MRTVKTEMVTLEARKVVDVRCDFCAAQIPLTPPDLLAPGDRQATSTIEHEESRRGEGETETKRVTYDCCVVCWDQKVGPALQRLAIRQPDFTRELIRG
jgi:hypothetical protein